MGGIPDGVVATEPIGWPQSARLPAAVDLDDVLRRYREMEWSEWRPFERNGVKGWERDGRRRA
jgi:hypothetical protein